MFRKKKKEDTFEVTILFKSGKSFTSTYKKFKTIFDGVKLTGLEWVLEDNEQILFVCLDDVSLITSQISIK